MKTKTLLLCAAAALTALSCSKSEQNGPDRVAHDGIIRINSSVDGKIGSKALTVGTAATSGIQFLVKSATTTDLTTLDFTGVTPITGDRAAAADETTPTAITLNPQQKYSTDDNTFYFLGYHPVGTTQTSPKTTWTIDGVTDIIVSDFWNAGRFSDPAASLLPMTFRHSLARVEVHIKGAEDVHADVVKEQWGKVTSATVETKPTMELDWATNLTSFTGADAYITLTKGITYADALAQIDVPAFDAPALLGSAMIAPNGTTKFNLKIKTEKMAAEQTIEVTLLGNVAKGKTHVVTLTFGAADKQITATSSVIEGWTTGFTGGGSVTPVAP